MLSTAAVLEAVGVSAYLGAAPLIQDPAVLGAAASIVTVESRHQTLLRTVLGSAAIPQAFDTGVGPRMVATLAKGFIQSCPPGSELKVEGLPDLKIVGAAGVGAGSVLKMDVTGLQPAAAGDMFCGFTGGDAGTVFAKFENGGCTVPEGLGGEVFVTVGTDGTTLKDETVLAGPALLSLT